MMSKSDELDIKEAMQNPDLLNFLHNYQKDPKAEALAAYQKAPLSVKRRVKALKNLQKKTFDLEADFFRKTNDLEREFETKYRTLYDQRAQVVMGKYEPMDEDCRIENMELLEDTFDDMKEMKVLGDEKVQIESNDTGEGISKNTTADGDTMDPKGIPGFWLTSFKNVDEIAKVIVPEDEELLLHLTDVTCSILQADEGKPGFNLDFHFSPNDYITDTVLRKTYYIRMEPLSIDPLSYEGPEIIQARGCHIHWKSGRSLTEKVLKIPMKGKSIGNEKRPTSKKKESFFHFFNPSTKSLDDINMATDDASESVDEEEEAMHVDFEIGQIIREKIIPKAVLYFTGEALTDEEEEEEEEEDDEDEGEKKLR